MTGSGWRELWECVSIMKNVQLLKYERTFPADGLLFKLVYTSLTANVDFKQFCIDSSSRNHSFDRIVKYEQQGDKHSVVVRVHQLCPLSYLIDVADHIGCAEVLLYSIERYVDNLFSRIGPRFFGRNFCNLPNLNCC